MGEAAVQQVHQQKREVVERIAGAQTFIEFQRVERCKHTFKQHDIT